MAKKVFCLLVIAVLALAPLTACGGPSRENTLKIYNWGDYISAGDDVDVDLLVEFEKFYEQKYNTDIKIVYETFDTNETMYIKIDKGREDWDLVCPSDYMLERMLRQGLLEPFNKEMLPNLEHISPFIAEKFAEIEEGNKPEGHEDYVYSVGYMWGTLGILYNIDAVEELGANDLIDSWDALWSELFEEKIYMKNSVRDSLGAAIMYVNREQLLEEKQKAEDGEITWEEYSEFVAEVFNSLSDEKLEAAKQALISQRKSLGVKYDVDLDKYDMVNGKYFVDLAWSGDAIWSVIETIEEGDGSVRLGYTIPKEGSNLWFDAWARPVYSRARDVLVHEFVNFMCDPESAIANMEAVGYVSVIGGEDVFEYAKETWEWQLEDDYFTQFGEDTRVNASYFFPDIAEAADVALNPIMYPHLDSIRSTAVMKDYGERYDDVLALWAEVKGGELSVWVYIGLGAVAAAAIGFAVFMRLNSSNKNKKRNGKRARAK